MSKDRLQCVIIDNNIDTYRVWHSDRVCVSVGSYYKACWLTKARGLSIMMAQPRRAAGQQPETGDHL